MEFHFDGLESLENVIDKPGNRVPCSVSMSRVTRRACEAVRVKFASSVCGVFRIRLLLLLLVLRPVARLTFPLPRAFDTVPWLVASFFHPPYRPNGGS